MAFEPSATNFEYLRIHVQINGVQRQVELVQAAVGDEDRSVAFEADKSVQSHITRQAEEGTPVVRCVRSDTF